MPLQLDAKAWREIFPRAPQPVIEAFARNQAVLDAAGITATKTRLAYALANVEHECGGFTIPNLTENINYTAARMAKVWPNRFKSAADVQRKYGTGKGWQLKALDDIYGNRMGNRPGTSDGSRYIGRGGPQITGRDGYREVGKRAGLDLENNPELASAPEHQPAILAAFWSWKNLNKYADAGDFLGCVKAWNGGTNGLADRQVQMKGNEPIIARLETVGRVIPPVNRAPEQKPPVAPAQPPGAPAPKGDAKAVGILTVIGGALTAAWAWFREHMPEIILGAAVLVVLALIAYRLIKGRWPWTGKTSVPSSPPQLLASEGSSEGSSVPLAQSLALQRDEFLAKRSASPAPPMPLLMPSETTPKPASSSRRRTKPTTRRSKQPQKPPASKRPQSTKRSERKSRRA